MNYQALIRDVPDFPIPGVLFRDVSPLLQDAEALDSVAHGFAKLIDLKNVDLFVGIESRGFIFAAMLAAKFNKGFLPLRKAGKLPPPVLQESYALEYGQATLEIAPYRDGKKRVIICDDVLATGGTLKASISLCEKAGYSVEDILVLIDLTFLNKLTFKNQKIKSLIQY
ncbi:MAG: adenine phosphoribosyltransferase [Bdellovibrionaceae bacterium]|nr:adenine phosphoribosyltransferase [Bdellovibrio sp.]